MPACAHTLPAPQRRLIQRLTTPARIQAFLDATPYSAEDRCPLSVLTDRQAHCFDGGPLGGHKGRRYSRQAWLTAGATMDRIVFHRAIKDDFSPRSDAAWGRSFR